MKYLALILLLSTSLMCCAVDTPKRVFIKASCDGRISSTILTSLREEIRGSKGYQLTTSLNDDGGLGAVLTIYVTCTELKGQGNSGIAAIAAIYGQARCISDSCHVNSYESTLRSALCGSNTAEECGRDLFRDFDDYWSGLYAPPLKLK